MRLLITRPEPDATKLKARLETLDHEATVEPLMSVTFDDADIVDVADVQAIVATSRNGLAGLKAQNAEKIANALPIFAVGKATAIAARALGFRVIITGAGTVHDLIPQIVSACDPQAGLILYLAGDTVTVDLAGELEPHGFRLDAPVVYRMSPAQNFTDSTFEQLATGEIDGVLLFSPRTADIYVELVKKHRVTASVSRMTHYCLSPAIARRLAPLGQIRIETADAPNLDAMLALLV